MELYNLKTPIRAAQWDGNEELLLEGMEYWAPIRHQHPPGYFVRCEGVRVPIVAGDWLIRLPNLELRVFKDKAFHKIYVPVDEEDFTVVASAEIEELTAKLEACEVEKADLEEAIKKADALLDDATEKISESETEVIDPLSDLADSATTAATSTEPPAKPAKKKGK